MEYSKACLPDVIQSRIEDLVNGQTVDEEIATHIRELGARIDALEGLAREGAEEEACRLGEDISRLCARIRRDYVSIAYRQGVADGARFRRVAEGEGAPAVGRNSGD